MAKGLTLTIVFDAMSLNYGEGLGNISELKKLSKGGEYYSYLSRQAIRYDIFRMLKDNNDIDQGKEALTEESKVVQFRPDTNIQDYVEADLFGYMKTKKGEGSVVRPAVVRFSPAISLEPFLSDIEFGSNKNFADRVKANPNPFQFEHHQSLYSYTVTIDLDKVGKDANDNIDIAKKQKSERVTQLLDVLKVLNREIKGRTESLNPLFVIGGVYNVKNPFFLNRIKITLDNTTKKYSIDTDILKNSSEVSFNGEKVSDNTNIGYISGFWDNQDEFKNIVNEALPIEEFFDKVKTLVEKHYSKN